MLSLLTDRVATPLLKVKELYNLLLRLILPFKSRASLCVIGSGGVVVFVAWVPLEKYG